MSVTTETTDATSAAATKIALIEGNNDAWSSLEAALTGSDEDVLTTPGAARWSVKDHLAHIENWERYLLALLEQRSPAAAISLDLATIRASDDDTLNELLIEATRAQPLSQVTADLRSTHDRLLGVIAALPEGEFERLAADYQPEELAGDPDSIAVWIHHICDEHLRDHVAWIQGLTAES
jgi:hypothetical protein